MYLNSPTYATPTKTICEVEIPLNTNCISTSFDTRVIKMLLESRYKLSTVNKSVYVLKNPTQVT